MQRRELFYAAPHDPFQSLKVGPSAGKDDLRLHEALSAWQAKWRAGERTEAAEIRHIADLARKSTASALALLDAGRAFDWLAGDDMADAFYKAALEKAVQEFHDIEPGDPSALVLLRALDQTKALWRIGDYRALELRFRLAHSLYPALSPESRRAGYLIADSLFYQHAYSDAADAILAVQAENIRAGDLGALDRSDIDEMNYMQGFLLSCAGRSRDAVPFLRLVRADGEHGNESAAALFHSLLDLHQTADAGRCLETLSVRAQLSSDAKAQLTVELRDAEQQQQWGGIALDSAFATEPIHGGE